LSPEEESVPSYDYTQFEDMEWGERYPADPAIVGASVWREFADVVSPEELLRQLQAVGFGTLRQNQKPCVFVSHRLADVARAKSLASAARAAGFDKWLDVEDPNLQTLSKVTGPLSLAAHAAAIACVIEMGLLNSTHVLALLSVNSPGSAWIPYEYGRVKDRRNITTDQAACFLDPGAPQPPAEYFCLGTSLPHDQAFQVWLASERAKFPATASPAPARTS